MGQSTWTPRELKLLDAAGELQIAVTRPDGTPGRRTPIWVVCADGQAYVRTWHHRDTGWYGLARRTRQAHITVPGLEADVLIDEAGPGEREPVDAAYLAKYGPGGGASMVTPEASRTTLRLTPA
jgi:hypothetical protein